MVRKPRIRPDIKTHQERGQRRLTKPEEPQDIPFEMLQGSHPYDENKQPIMSPGQGSQKAQIMTNVEKFQVKDIKGHERKMKEYLTT
ncbi:hypothetical protein NHQ30_001419 [Ciborinia camelliae]|nr:hypothetical protein NHQ30_001419 [Ciborinia camelliae]